MSYLPSTVSVRLVGLAAVSLLAVIPAYAEDAAPAGQSSLAPVSSAEWQNLLAPQVSKQAVSFTNTKIPNEPLSSYQRVFAWNEVALDTTAIGWAVETRQAVQRFPVTMDWVRSLAISPDGEQLGVAGGSFWSTGQVMLFDTETGHIRQQFPVAANVTGGLVTIADAARDALTRQVTGAVRWVDCVKELVKAGPQAFVEVDGLELHTVVEGHRGNEAGSRKQAAQTFFRLTDEALVIA